jgi:hypothetical protein
MKPTPGSTIRRLQRALTALTTLAPPEALARERAETLLVHLTHVPIAILIANNQARYVDVNRAAARLTGYTRAELLRLSLWDLTPSPNRTTGRRLWRDFLRRGRMTGRFPLRRKNGRIVRATYFAVAHVLPGIHVSALVPARARARPSVKKTRVRR